MKSGNGPGAKIAFIGTHGVGKTILTFSIASHLRKLNYDADVAYENARTSPFPINEATTLEGQMWILAAQWKNELEASLRSGILICDRSVIDNYAYMVHAAGRQEYLHPFLMKWLSTYRLLLWVPIIDDDIVADRSRTTNQTFQRQIHDIIGSLVQEFNLGTRVVELPHDRNRHLTLILEALRERGVLGEEAFQLKLF